MKSSKPLLRFDLSEKQALAKMEQYRESRTTEQVAGRAAALVVEGLLSRVRAMEHPVTTAWVARQTPE